MDETSQFLSQAFRLLRNSGFHNLRADSEYIYMENPSCILRSFETFLEYAWIIITVLAGLLLMGWAISMLRGAKYDNIFVNMRNLMLIFFGLSMTKPVINLVYGGDLFARGCGTTAVSIDEIKKMLDARSAKLKKHNDNQLYEDLIIHDSGVVIETGDETPDETSETLEDIIDHAETIAPEEKQEGKLRSMLSLSGTPQSATASGDDVIYTMSDGVEFKRSGGSRAWRNFNPGNIEYSEFAQKAGAIGQAGGLAIFPSEKIGTNAIKELLRTDTYINLTVVEAIKEYAKNNHIAIKQINTEKQTELSAKNISDLTSLELDIIARIIKNLVNWESGKTQII